jgi:outer membrane protein TolC
LQAALHRAAERNPALAEAVANLRAQEAFTAAVDALLRPNLAASASFSVRQGGARGSSGEQANFEGLLPYTPNWDIGLVLRWPIYDGIVAARVDAARQREEIRRAAVDITAQALNAAVQQAYVRTAVAEKAIDALVRAEEAAEANYAQAEARFRAGLATAVELADAEAVRTDAEIQLAIGRFDLARARAQMARLIAEGL